MKYSVPEFDVNVEAQGIVLDLDSLHAHLARLHDGRDARGMRYALVTILVLVVLAKVAGEDRVSGIAEWVAHRVEKLGKMLHWVKVRAPHRTTYSRVLGQALDIEEFEQVVRQFFASFPGAGESVLITLDGKTLLGTIPA